MDQPIHAIRAFAGGSLLSLVAMSAYSAAQVTPYGSGINPAGSLTVIQGTGALGSALTLGVSNPLSTATTLQFAYLSLSTAPDPAFPAGTPLAGFGLSGPGSIGELLISVAPPDSLTFGPQAWEGASSPPATFFLVLPPAPQLAGLTLFGQGLLVDPLAGPSVGLTNGLSIPLAEPNFPGLVRISPGTFLMGSAAGNSNEQPVHQVTISQPFWMGLHEVTQAEYELLMASNPSMFVEPSRPVERVSWNAAMQYCAALTAQQTAWGMVPVGYQYRLPTEAEWEYGCRAGTTTEYFFGETISCDEARFSHIPTSPITNCNNPTGTKRVGSYAPNAWGLHDMHGNVNEWCLDSFRSYTDSPKTDPYYPDGPERVIRGGGWTSVSTLCRSARRTSQSPFHTSNAIGFRVVLAPILVP